MERSSPLTPHKSRMAQIDAEIQKSPSPPRTAEAEDLVGERSRGGRRPGLWPPTSWCEPWVFVSIGKRKYRKKMGSGLKAGYGVRLEYRVLCRIWRAGTGWCGRVENLRKPRHAVSALIPDIQA